MATASGPAVGPSKAEQDAESYAETNEIGSYLNRKRCLPGDALELALGTDSSRNAFLINPISLPVGVSLIIDGGVTVYGSRNPKNYQDKSSNALCGTIGHYNVNEGCLGLITLPSGSGVYGYGVIDGQGDKLLLGGRNANTATWWDLTLHKKDSKEADEPCPQPDPNVPPVNRGGSGNGNTTCEQSSPVLITSANINGAPDTDLKLYKITIRNPPYHTVRLVGDGITVWGAKVQSPWDIPNTDGFDVQGSDITFYDTTVSNGDQQIVLVSKGGPTSNVTVDHFHGYSKGGVTILGNGESTSQVLVQNSDITGDIASLVNRVIDGKSEMVVNGMPESELVSEYGLKSYGQALPNATNEIEGLQITNSNSTGNVQGSQISDVTYRSVCLADVGNPITIDLNGTSQPPSVRDVHFEDIHVLKPTSQFPQMTGGIVTDPTELGRYQLTLDAVLDANGSPLIPNQISFENVVFDQSDAGKSSIGLISANGNEISTFVNIFPSVLNRLHESTPTDPDGIQFELSHNSYTSRTPVSAEYLAKQCHPMPFIVGDLYLSAGAGAGALNNSQGGFFHEKDRITLNAVVQPVMSQTTLLAKHTAEAGSGHVFLAVGSPALTETIRFYDGSRFIGSAPLSANGTLASLTLGPLSPGVHVFRAQYPADSYYSSLVFGSVTVQVAP